MGAILFLSMTILLQMVGRLCYPHPNMESCAFIQDGLGEMNAGRYSGISKPIVWGTPGS